jgi:pilus assembly protein Flp/PilA
MTKRLIEMQVWLASRKKQKGQSLAEYGLILALIAVVCIAALTLMGTNISAMLNGLAGTIKSVPTSP